MDEAGDERVSAERGDAIGKRIAEIRSAEFAGSRRGYDREEVKGYLAALADWLESLGLGGADRGELRRELAWVGERTAEILTKAEETARELVEKGEADAQRMHDEAAAEAEGLREAAVEEARRTRLEAGSRAEETITAAERRAEELLEQAAARRQDLQALIGDLIERRDEIVADGQRLVDELSDLFVIAAEEPGEELPEDEDDQGDDEPESAGFAPDETVETDAVPDPDDELDPDERSLPLDR